MILQLPIVHIRASVLSPLSSCGVGACRGLLPPPLCVFTLYGVILALSKFLSTIDHQVVIDLIIFLFFDVSRLMRPLLVHEHLLL